MVGKTVQTLSSSLENDEALRQQPLLLLTVSHKSSREIGGREERWNALDFRQGVLPQYWGGNEANHTVTCMMLKATDNDRRKIPAHCRNEFRRPSSDVTVDQVA
ncbi:hypothetical protein TNCV_3654161 [Trichonephila clavipes]|nr:hypothetical protein TNCV_3654161 [Trichonephila clavipes]